jgi:hypothetical protein
LELFFLLFNYSTLAAYHESNANREERPDANKSADPIAVEKRRIAGPKNEDYSKGIVKFFYLLDFSLAVLTTFV